MAVITPPKYVQHILKALEDNGYSAYLAGGSVRDVLMGATPHDWDIATSAKCEDVARIFSHTAPTGIQYGTVTVFHGDGRAEVTTFRKEGAYIDSRHPQKVTFVSDLEEDLRRRDFTINAMAMDSIGRLKDPFSGYTDLKSKLIRCVGVPEERFAEDALRMLRAFRFAATLDFVLERKTLYALYSCAPYAKNLSAERVAGELTKILMSDKPEMMERVINTGLMDKFIITRGANSDRFFHLTQIPKDEKLRLSALCALLWEDNLIIKPEVFLKALRFSKKTVDCVSSGCKLALTTFPSDKIGIKKLLAQNGRLTTLCAAAAAYVTGKNGSVRKVEAVLKSGECYSLDKLQITGSDLLSLGISGITVGRVLNLLLEHVIEYPDDNNRDILITIAKQMDL